MNEPSVDRFAAGVHSLARGLAYPPTPEIHLRQSLRTIPYATRSRFLRRRLAWVAIVVLFALASLLAVPQARAAVVRIIQIGVVRIFLERPSQATPTGPVTVAPAASILPQNATPSPTPPMVMPAVLDEITGETTLEEARGQTRMKIRLPTYPSDLGPPDRVFLQDQGGPVVLLAWLSPDDSHRLRLVLVELSSESWGLKKVQIEALTATTVDGQPGVWAEGPYLLIYRNGDVLETRLVEGHVLIWEQAGITYRLESDLSMEEAVRVAESLK